MRTLYTNYPVYKGGKKGYYHLLCTHYVLETTEISLFESSQLFINTVVIFFFQIKTILIDYIYIVQLNLSGAKPAFYWSLAGHEHPYFFTIYQSFDIRY